MRTLGTRSPTAGGRRRPTYLIQDPHDLDAIELIRTIELYYGLRPVCFYTDRRARFLGERQHPELRSDLIEAAYDVSLDDLGSLAEQVRQDFDVVGVVPYGEHTIVVGADLSEMLGLEWNDPGTLRRFRDKYAQKRHLIETAPQVRVPFGAFVKSADELRLMDLPERFVLKPNDGMANMSIGIFGRDDVEAAVRHLDDGGMHVRRGGKDEWLLEEYVDGTEYHVDGQVRADGSIDVLGVFEYVRGVINHYPTVYLADFQCRTNEEPFAEVVSYAVELIGATGLRACPFHLEVKVDSDGPCLIDFGARMASEGTGRMLTRLHPERPSAYLVAAHDYLGRTDLADLPLTWDHYDSTRVVLAFGVAEADVRIRSLHGLDEVEAMSEFVRWPKRPEVGAFVPATKDLLESPWVAEMELAGSREDAIDLAGRVRSMVGWNRADGFATNLSARIDAAVDQFLAKARWRSHRLEDDVRARLAGQTPGVRSAVRVDPPGHSRT